MKTSCKEVKSSIISSQPPNFTLYTASKFILNEDTVSFINNCISTLRHPIANQSNNDSEVVLLSSDDENDSTLKSIPVWVTHGRHKLTAKDKHILVAGKQLKDILINFACTLLKKQFPQFGGFQ